MSENFEIVNRDLLGQCPGLLSNWLPGGKVIAGEYCCSNLMGGGGQSLKINLNSGKWCDFATEQKGTDLISLYAAINGWSQGDALKHLIGQKPKHTPDRKPKETQAKPETVHKPIQPPKKTKYPPMGKGNVYYKYKNEQGEILFFIERIEREQGKLFLPWTFNGQSWQKKSWPEPRPLYGIDYVVNNPTKPVLIVEGEKAAEAAKVFVQDRYSVITWPGGAMAVAKADWRSLKVDRRVTPDIKQRDVIIWPDNDEAGFKAAELIKDKIFHYCPYNRPKIIEVVDRPKGWDAADSGFKTYQEFEVWYKPIAHTPQELCANLEKNEDGKYRVITGERLWNELNIPLNGKNNPFYNELTVVRVLENHKQYKGKFHFDTFKNLYMYDGKPVDDDTMRTILCHLQDKVALNNVKETQVRTAVFLVAKKKRINSMQEKIKSYKWNDEPYILENFFYEIYGADDEGDEHLMKNIRALGRNFWLSWMARINEPGCQVDNMIILRGKEGTGKSQSLRLIAGDGHSSTTLIIRDPAKYGLAIVGKTLIEFAELVELRKNDAKVLHNFITTSVDNYRVPYDRISKDVPRGCIFVGTTNDQFLLPPEIEKDGQRRFHIVDIKKADLEKLKELLPRYFAEAYHRYKKGESWWEGVEYSEVIREESRIEHPWTQKINEMLQGRKKAYIEARKRGDMVNDYISFDEIFTFIYAERHSNNPQRDKITIGIIVSSSLGIKSRRKRIRGIMSTVIMIDDIKFHEPECW